MLDASIPRRSAVLCAGFAVAALVAAACTGDVPTDPEAATPNLDRPAPPPTGTFSRAGAAGRLPPDVRSQLTALRRGTAPYHDVRNARDDGWSTAFPEPCLTHAREGGMGLHLLNPTLLQDDAGDEVEVTRPEFLVYEPGPGDQMRLVAVEYVVPFAAHPSDAAPPTLFGRAFHPNETFGVWALHVWAWRHNPSGIFADWNPKVSCEHADTVRRFPED